MTCVVSPGGDECPYREQYGCDDATRELGLKLGHCAVERLWRDEARDETKPALEGLPFGMGRTADLLTELLLDAWVYVLRSRAWAAITFGRDPGQGGCDVSDPVFTLAAIRYRGEGLSRLRRRFLQLQVCMDAAKVERHSGRLERLRHVASRAG